VEVMTLKGTVMAFAGETGAVPIAGGNIWGYNSYREWIREQLSESGGEKGRA